ncbi:MAG: hypothetical protein U0Y82_15645 [Thermoleophilia bacterium]
MTAPNDGSVVVGAPLLEWNPVNGAAIYRLQFSQSPAFDDVTDGTSLPGTEQVAYTPTGTDINKAGQWYWRVRAEFGDGDAGPWSATRTFNSVVPPKFNLAKLPAKVTYGRRLVISGQLTVSGKPVANPPLVVERRVWPASEYTPYGTVSGDAGGRFAFTLPQTRSAGWRIRWAKTGNHPEGVMPFALRVVPRVAFRTSSTRVERRHSFSVRGSVYPARAAYVQLKSASGWENLGRVPASGRFHLSVKASMAAGRQQLRLFVPADDQHVLDATGSVRRGLFVYDRIVIG